MDNNLTLENIDSIDFAIYLNEKANQLGLDVNMTKIQKWLYVCYGIYLSRSKKQLFNERPKAWDYGPVFPNVYSTQKRNNDSLNSLPYTNTRFEQLDDIIMITLNTFGEWSAGQLVGWTHQDNLAWDKKIKSGEKYSSLDNLDILLDFETYSNSI